MMLCHLMMCHLMMMLVSSSDDVVVSSDDDVVSSDDVVVLLLDYGLEGPLGNVPHGLVGHGRDEYDVQLVGAGLDGLHFFVCL